MASPLASGIFGLASAASWGAGDFAGGMAARRAHVFSVAAVAKVSALATMLVFALALAERVPPPSTMVWAVAAGVAGAIGLVALYQALAVGVMGVVAPVSAVVAVSMPVFFAALSEGLPSGSQVAGFGLAMIAVWLVSRPSGPVRFQRNSIGVGLAVLAGVGFGGFYVLISLARAESVFWPLAASQAATLCSVLAAAGVAALARRTGGRTIASSWPVWLMVLAGVLDSGGNAFFLLAQHAGRLDVAAVLASLYPASTVVLARAVLGERVSGAQSVGIAVALAAIPLIAG